METLALKISTSQNKALNADGVTALRQLNLLQGETYEITLAPAPHQPAYEDFSFILRTKQGTTNVAEVTSITGNTFTLVLDSVTLNSALVGRDYGDFRAFLSWSEAGEIEVIEPFAVRIAATDNSLTLADYVSSVNGISDAVTITGAGIASVSKVGQTITITATQTGNFATNAALQATGASLGGSISALQSQTGSYASNAALEATGAFLAANSTIPSDVVRTTGNQYLAGTKSFSAGLHALGSYSQVWDSLTIDASDSNPYKLTLNPYVIGAGQVGYYFQTVNQTTTGTPLSFSHDGYALISKVPTATGHVANKGYVDTSLSSYSTTSTLSATSGALQTQITNLSNATGNYYPRTNPSGYATQSALSAHTGNASNPHNVTKTQIGLSGVTNDLQLKAADLVTSVSWPGSDTKVPSEKAVRTRLDAIPTLRTNAAALTKIVAEIAAQPASNSAGLGGGSANYIDGDTFTVTHNGVTQTFEVDLDMTLNDSSAIGLSDSTGGYEAILYQLANAIVYFYGSSITAYWGSGTLSVSTTATGTSQSFTIIDPRSNVTMSATGTDYVAASGTSQATLVTAVFGKRTIVINAFITLDGTPWTEGVELGYWDGATFIPLSLAVPGGGVTALYDATSLTGPAPSNFGLINDGMTSQHLMVRQVSPEYAGGDITILVTTITI